MAHPVDLERRVPARIEAVRRLIAAARTIVDQRARHVPALVESTGLSPEGVDLALRRHLEIDPSDADLHQLVARAGAAPQVTVILSANVFVGALRALAIARAAADRVVIRPSRRDPAFARALVAAAADPAIALVDELDVAGVDEGEIHVYGRDDTIAEVRRRSRPHVLVRGHGSGMGIAIVSEAAELAGAAAALANDVVVFDQRGCLSPRIAFVEGADARAEAFAGALHRALERLATVVPRGLLSADDRAAADRYVATMTYAGRALVGPTHAVGVAPPDAPLVLPPPFRHVHVASVASLAGARARLVPLARGIVAAGSDDAAAARAVAPAWARLSPLGEMQRPPLDGPVDLRDDLRDEVGPFTG